MRISFNLTRRRGAALGAGVALLAGAGGAWAYFAQTSKPVVTFPIVGVAPGVLTATVTGGSGAVTPGGSATLNVKIQEPASAPASVTLQAISFAIPSAADGNALDVNGAEIPNCKAADFTATYQGNNPQGSTLSPGSGSYLAVAAISMPQSSADQSGCAGTSPELQVIVANS